jgi:hypothetical protein
VSGDAGYGRPGRRAAAHLILLYLLAQLPAALTVGRVTVVTWPSQAALGIALADATDRAAPFPGLGPLPDRPLRLILAPTREAFDSITRSRMPSWSGGAAFPETGTIVLLSDHPTDRLSAALRHELAHLALRWGIGHRLPLWFEEGYAAVAAGEWGRLDGLRMNWQLARGRTMDLDDLDRALRGDATDAAGAYALATTAVLLLERWGGDRGLGPLLGRLPAAPSFDAALRDTYHVTEGDFEERWQRDLRSRYGWLAWADSVGVFWAVLGLLLVGLVMVRRRRDRVRRERLDEGWTIPPDEPPSA